MIENQEDLPYTVFSDNLKVQNLSTNEGNILFVSDSFANAANVKLSDNLNILFNETPINFTISGIYKGDHREVGGTIIAIINEDIQQRLNNGSVFGFAFFQDRRLILS